MCVFVSGCIRVNGKAATTNRTAAARYRKDGSPEKCSYLINYTLSKGNVHTKRASDDNIESQWNMPFTLPRQQHKTTTPKAIITTHQRTHTVHSNMYGW